MQPMVATRTTNVTRKGAQFPSIKAAARAMKVHRVTLWRNLSGRVPDTNGLRIRYLVWLAKRHAEEAETVRTLLASHGEVATSPMRRPGKSR